MCVTYRLFKKQLYFETYLLNSNNSKRIALAKFRCANSKLPIYSKIYMYDTHVCTLCSLNVHGDEYHYILICPFFKKERELYLDNWYTCRPDLLKFEQLFTSLNKRTQARLSTLVTCIVHKFK